MLKRLKEAAPSVFQHWEENVAYCLAHPASGDTAGVCRVTMSTKWFSGSHADRPNPFDSPYDAYITYMNVLADFELRLEAVEQKKSRKGSRNSLRSGAGASA